MRIFSYKKLYFFTISFNLPNYVWERSNLRWIKPFVVQTSNCLKKKKCLANNHSNFPRVSETRNGTLTHLGQIVDHTKSSIRKIISEMSSILKRIKLFLRWTSGLSIMSFHSNKNDPVISFSCIVSVNHRVFIWGFKSLLKLSYFIKI